MKPWIKILIGLILGVIAGLVVGHKVDFLERIGNAFIEPLYNFQKAFEHVSNPQVRLISPPVDRLLFLELYVALYGTRQKFHKLIGAV